MKGATAQSDRGRIAAATARSAFRVPRSEFAFTLIELLVVVAIIAALISILLPSMTRSRRTAKEVTCGVDIRMLTVTSQTYANEYQGWFPQMQYNPVTKFTNPYAYHSYPYWRDFMQTRYSLQRSHWYSPNNLVWNDDELYYFGWNGVDPDTATNMVMGRFYFGTGKLVDDPAFKGAIVDPTIPTTGRVFASRADQKAAVSLLWTDLNRQWNGEFYNGGNRWGSNHMYEPQRNWPTGNHLGHTDGSVEWVTGADVRLRILYPIPGQSDMYW